MDHLDSLPARHGPFFPPPFVAPETHYHAAPYSDSIECLILDTSPYSSPTHDRWTAFAESVAQAVLAAQGLATVSPCVQPSYKLSAFLSHFYSDLHNLLTEERIYLPAIFPDPISTLSSFIQTTLEGLTPSFPHRLTSIADAYGPGVLPGLILAFKATEEFAVKVERIFAKLEPPLQQPSSPSPSPSPTPPRPGHSPSSPSLSSGLSPTPNKRRLSKRRSLSRGVSARSISFAAGTSPDFDSENGEDEGGEGGVVYVRPWETALFEPFLDWQLAGGVGSAEEEQERVLEGLEYSTEDWSTFQFGVKLLDTCRAMSQRLASFEAKFKARMTVLAHSIREAREHPTMYTTPGTTKGEVLLLRQPDPQFGRAGVAARPAREAARERRAWDAPRSACTDSLPLAARALGSRRLHSHDPAFSPRDAPRASPLPFERIPTSSLSPTKTISRVGEGLFNLPRLFAIYADDDALAFSIETLPFVHLESLRALQHPSLPSCSPILRQSSSGHRTTSADALNSKSSMNRPHRGSSISLSSAPPLTAPSAETVIAAWLSSLAL
ncbi:hypothetical protein JCM1841_006586 [Sporobolomyces salmonicolor]